MVNSDMIRRRAILAASCLPDEPSVSDAAARKVLTVLVNQIREGDGLYENDNRTELDYLVLKLSKSEKWGNILRELLLERFIGLHGRDQSRMHVGLVYLMAYKNRLFSTEESKQIWKEILIERLNSGNEMSIIDAALITMEQAFQGVITYEPKLVNILFSLLDYSAPVATAVIWALRWIIETFTQDGHKWKLTKPQSLALLKVMKNPNADRYSIINCLRILSRICDVPCLYEWSLVAGQVFSIDNANAKSRIFDDSMHDAVVKMFGDDDKQVRKDAALLLGRYGIKEIDSIDVLVSIVSDDNTKESEHAEAIQYLISMPNSKIVDQLISNLKSRSMKIRNSALIGLVGLSKSMDLDAYLAKLHKPTPQAQKLIATIAGFLRRPGPVNVLASIEVEPNLQYELRMALDRLQGIVVQDWSLTDQFHTDKILACILLKGETKNRKLGYAYVAIHLTELAKLLVRVDQNKRVNPKDFNSTILARFTGEPSEEVKAFMRRKFGFSDDCIVIQREREKALGQRTDTSPYIKDDDVPSTKDNPIGKNKSKYPEENDFPFSSITYVRIGSGYIHPTPFYETDLGIFNRYVSIINNTDDNNLIVFEKIDP